MSVFQLCKPYVGSDYLTVQSRENISIITGIQFQWTEGDSESIYIAAQVSYLTVDWSLRATHNRACEKAIWQYVLKAPLVSYPVFHQFHFDRISPRNSSQKKGKALCTKIFIAALFKIGSFWKQFQSEKNRKMTDYIH